MNNVRGSIGNRYDARTGKEIFQWKKLRSAFNLGSGVDWVKDIVSIFNLRKLIIYAVVAILLFGSGWYQGLKGKPVKIDIGYGKEAYIKLNGNKLHITENGYVFVEDKKGNVLKQIKVKDVPELRKALRPYGLKLEPFVLAGYSTDKQMEEGKAEAGVGVSFLKAWKMNLDAFITTYPAVYIGSSYQITDSSGIGIGVGKGLRDDSLRGIVYVKFKW